jgi:hypothetical protein
MRGAGGQSSHRRLSPGWRIALTAPLLCLTLQSCNNTFTLPRLETTKRVDIQAAVDAVDPEILRQTLEAIGAARAGGISACRDELVARFAAAGVAGGIEVLDGDQNIIAQLPGLDLSARPVYVQAHWDWIDQPAMDDNASGTAGVIETARVLAASGLQFRRTIRFVLFDGEEQGMTGSSAHVANLTASTLPSFFLNYDMIGYTSNKPDTLCAVSRQEKGNYIDVFIPEWAAEGAAEFARDAHYFAPDLRFFAATLPAAYARTPILDNATRSDNEPFWGRGVHGLFLTTADRNPHYHTAGDTLDTLDIAFLAMVVKAGLACLCVKAEMQ